MLKFPRFLFRIRPLTADMKKYAREDTHYLLYISDELRVLLVNESGEQDRLEEVLKRSEELCKQAYQKPIVTVNTGIEMINKYVGALEVSHEGNHLY